MTGVAVEVWAGPGFAEGLVIELQGSGCRGVPRAGLQSAKSKVCQEVQASRQGSQFREKKWHDLAADRVGQQGRTCTCMSARF